MLKGESHVSHNKTQSLSDYVTLDDSGNYVMFHELNVPIKINKNNNSSQRELGSPVLHNAKTS